MRIQSVNFAFLAAHSEVMVKTAAQAEQYFSTDPSGSITKLRRFGELIAEGAAAHLGAPKENKERQFDLVLRLKEQALFGDEIERLFTELRKAGNAAVHEDAGTRDEALTYLQTAHTLAIWYQRWHAPDFEPQPFKPPPTPEDAAAAERERFARLRKELKQSEAEAAKAYEEAAAAIELSAETEAQLAEERARFEAELAELRVAAEAQSEEQRAADIHAAREAEDRVELTEDQTRERIDQQLRQAGWEADSNRLRHGKGARPQKGRKLAISEWPTSSGPADYVLFDGLTAVGIVEAKRESKDISGSLEQAKRYSRDFDFRDGAEPAGGPWRQYKVPFLFATNGRPFMRQFLAASGIWHTDVRDKGDLPRALEDWKTPEGLAKALSQDVGAANDKLTSESAAYLPLRPYQHEAVTALEARIAAGQRDLLLEMATGTGKTRTLICLIYRLLKAGRFKRVLFLVDRTSLGVQAQQAFENLALEQHNKFTDIYDVKVIGETDPESDTRLQIATIQAMVRRLDDEERYVPVDQYDLIVVDECHRGYNLDAEMSELELAYRSQDEYVSKYRRVLDHFDAVKIGLTATPAQHTTTIFGEPVYSYKYQRAVIEGFLVDHEPPTRITTSMDETGVSWALGEEMMVWRTDKKDVDLVHAPDDVELDVTTFNKKVIVPAYNRAICRALAKEIDPSSLGKTLIFCTNDRHADAVVDMLREAFKADDDEFDTDAVVKITGKADKPASLIARFKNEKLPSVAVTVDLLTTGIDVPEIVNLVFLRRVRSRILYDQMIGRGTRLCTDIGKHYFRIFDAVDIYRSLYDYTDMKPVVSDVKTGFGDLLRGLEELRDLDQRRRICEQLLAKLQRKHRSLHGKRRDEFATLSGAQIDDLIEQLRNAGPDEILAWWRERPALADWLDALVAKGKVLPISQEEPTDVSTGTDYHQAEDAAAFLEAFGAYLREHQNELPAFELATERPHELTRAQLEALELALAQAGYREAALDRAVRETSGRDLVPKVLGHLRTALLGVPLLHYEQRVHKALDVVLGGREWSTRQREWIGRIAAQMRVGTVVDADVMNKAPVFVNNGGKFKRLNKKFFEGELEQLLRQLAEGAWSDG